MPRNITVKFSDGTSHQYNNAPDDFTPDQVETRTKKDYPNKKIIGIDGGKKSSSWDSQEKNNDGDLRVKAKYVAKLALIYAKAPDAWGKHYTPEYFIKQNSPPNTAYGTTLDPTDIKMLSIGIEELGHKPSGFYNQDELIDVILKKSK